MIKIIKRKLKTIAFEWRFSFLRILLLPRTVKNPKRPKLPATVEVSPIPMGRVVRKKIFHVYILRNLANLNMFIAYHLDIVDFFFYYFIHKESVANNLKNFVSKMSNFGRDPRVHLGPLWWPPLKF